MKYTVYILNCSDNTYYTGVTNNIERRLQEHLTNEGENSYTFQRRPLHLVFQLDFLDVNQAIEFEKQVKGWRREKKEALIKGDWDILKGLAECLNETSHRNFLESRLSSTPLRLTLAQEQKVEQKQDPGQKEDQKRVPEKDGFHTAIMRTRKYNITNV